MKDSEAFNCVKHLLENAIRSHEVEMENVIFYGTADPLRIAVMKARGEIVVWEKVKR